MTASETNDPLLRAALEATCETAAVDFKAGLDVDSKGEWLEVLKDLVAMANSGGGVILFGLSDSSNPTGSAVEPILDYDASRIGDKLRKYTGVHFGNFTLFPSQRGAAPVAAIRVSDYVVAAKSPSIRYYPDCKCPKCKGDFDWEVEPAALIADPRLMFHGNIYSGGVGRSSERWTYAHEKGGMASKPMRPAATRPTIR
jgi:hypothetical protein